MSRTRTSGDGRRLLVEVRPDRVAPIGAPFDLYGEAIDEAAGGFTAAELAVVARLWDRLGRAVEGRQPGAQG